MRSFINDLKIKVVSYNYYIKMTFLRTSLSETYGDRDEQQEIEEIFFIV